MEREFKKTDHPHSSSSSSSGGNGNTRNGILFSLSPKMVLHFQLIDILSQLAESNIQNGNSNPDRICMAREVRSR